MTTLSVDGNITDLAAISDILAEIDPDGDHKKAVTGKEALEAAKQYQLDVVFLETELPDSDGIEIAEKILIHQTETNIVFVTENKSYAMQAFDLFASGYLLKNVTEQDIRRTMRNLRYPIKHGAEGTRRLKVRCFGTFEAFVNGIPLTFERTKTKQLLAYLIDRQGDICDIQQMICALWPESDGGSSTTNYLRRLMSDLQSVLNVHGVGDAVTRSWGKMQINKDRVDCDYYDYLSGKSEAAAKFRGEYMSQYSMGEMTLAALTMSLKENLIPLSSDDTRLKVKCFDVFEISVNDEPLIFTRRKSRELFAYLIDRQGAVCPVDEAVNALWGEKYDTDSAKHIFRTVLYELKKNLRDAGIENVLIKEHRQLALRKNMIDCDYWHLLSGGAIPAGLSADSYLHAYSWAEPSRKSLQRIMNKL